MKPPSSQLQRLALRLWRLPLPGWLRGLAVWLANPKFLATATALVRSEQGEVLLFRHTYRELYPWGLPGGFIQLHEDPAQAVQREIMEEAGLAVRVVRPLWVGIGPPPRSVDIVYLAVLAGGEFRASPEVSAATFFPPDRLPLSPETREFVLRLVAAAAEPAGAD